MKFVCEFIIDSYDQDDKPSISLMENIFKALVTKDDIKKEQLQHLKEFKDNISKLCKITLEDIPISRYLDGLRGEE